MTEYSNRGPANDNSGASEFCEFGEFESASRERHVACEVTQLTNHRGPATKIIDLDEVGELRKQSAAYIYEGEADRVMIEGLEGLRDLIKSLSSNQALCFGIAEQKKARLLTQEALRSGSYPDAIARDREHFSFSEGKPGVLMLDCDAPAVGPGFTWKKIDGILASTVPAWLDTKRLWRASSSAFIYRESDGSELIGAGSWRCYTMVDDASAIPAIGAFIYQSLWEKGNDALDEIAGERGRINPRMLGRWIERYADTRCGGFYLERWGSRQHAAVWRIRQCAPQPTGANPQQSHNSSDKSFPKGGPMELFVR